MKTLPKPINTLESAETPIWTIGHSDRSRITFLEMLKEHEIEVLESAETPIWTIGHSDRSRITFLEMLKEHEIEVLVDVRRFPTSKVEHFKREAMEQWLPEQGIEYVWLGEELGGYRQGGYKAYMRTKQFEEGIERLSEIARQKRTCMMCLEPNPKYCHRRFVSAYLERKGVKVAHIIAKGQTSPIKFKIQNS